MVLGQTYIHNRYRDAVVHVIVHNEEGDEAGGTAFFCSDYPGHVVTARHVAAEPGYSILRIEDRDGNLISDNIADAQVPEDQNLDLALVPCVKPDEVVPLRIEWRNEELETHSPILVLGYPLVAGHQPALIHATGEVIGVPTRTDSDRVSLLISRVTQPGFSGGPVISSRGRVLGIVERENVLQQAHDSIFITAVPALYLRELQLEQTAGNSH